MAFSVLALTNVVTGVFVESALKSAHDEEESVMLETLIQMFWQEENSAGMLSRTQFEERLSEPAVIAYLRSIHVDSAEVEMLFSLIDVDDNGSIDYGEFVSGCMRIRGSARAIDTILLLHEL